LGWSRSYKLQLSSSNATHNPVQLSEELHNRCCFDLDDSMTCFPVAFIAAIEIVSL